MESVFDYEDYKLFLNAWIHAQPKGGRGMKSTFAEVAKCQTAFISQVLNGDAHFNLEQAHAISEFISQTAEEFNFFVLLIQNARAGSAKLKLHFSSQIKSVRDQRVVIKNRVRAKQTLTKEDQATYYSHWLYAAVHIAVTISQLRTREALAKYFSLPPARITRITDFLLGVGLLVADKHNAYSVGEARIHLVGDSTMISKHHTNWRMKAIQSLEKETTSDLHYSSVATLSREDVAKIKDLFIRSIEKANAIISPSKEEELWCIGLDMFEL